MGPRIGVAENRQNVRNQPPLSSALFYIRLVIRHFSKTAEDRSSADTGVPPCHPVTCGILHRCIYGMCGHTFSLTVLGVSSRIIIKTFIIFTDKK